MKIKGVEGMSVEEVREEVSRGGRFVFYTYTISLLVITLKRTSAVYFVKAGQGSVVPGLGYSLLTLLLGWWGIPWGPIYSIATFITNFRGGKDVTHEIMASF